VADEWTTLCPLCFFLSTTSPSLFKVQNGRINKRM
jgi:hypothetical protein